MTTTKYSVIQEGTVYIDYGPITMTLEARREGYPFTEAAVAGAERVLEVFNDFTVYLDFLRKPLEYSEFENLIKKIKRYFNITKGVFVFEYDLRANNSGDFSNGITTIQSMYAPEFSSHSEGIRVKVGTIF